MPSYNPRRAKFTKLKQRGGKKNENKNTLWNDDSNHKPSLTHNAATRSRVSFDAGETRSLPWWFGPVAYK